MKFLSAARCSPPASAIAQIHCRLVVRGLGVGYCARTGAVDVRLTARGAGAEEIVAAATDFGRKYWPRRRGN
jgi:hypothetical protein